MKIFAIRDEYAAEQVDLAYLLYYELEKRFYIELPENADPWETPDSCRSLPGPGSRIGL